MLLLKPKLVSSGAQIIHVNPDKHARLWGVFPLYEEEMELKLREGSDRIEELFAQSGVTELLDPQRPSVAKQH